MSGRLVEGDSGGVNNGIINPAAAGHLHTRIDDHGSDFSIIDELTSPCFIGNSQGLNGRSLSEFD
ncbi:hypothetical protein D3C71_2073370 [compost metagenome]